MEGTEYINEVFGPKGHLAKHLPGYAPRPAQMRYASAVAYAIGQGKHALVEGSTGTGKSAGYLVPATHYAATQGKTVVVCTANIALTEQLVNKDLPMLKDALPWDFTFAQLKGRQNYLCLNEHYKQKNQPGMFDEEHHQAILAWGEMTKTGDKSDLPFEPSGTTWSKFSVSADACDNDSCAFFRDCLAFKARNEAIKSNVIVTNYHVLFSHIQLRQKTGRDLLLPEYGLLIMDEAHRVADIARDFLGFRLTEGSVTTVANRLRRYDKDTAFLLDQAGRQLFDRVRNLRFGGGYKARLKQPGQLGVDECSAALTRASDVFGRAAGEVSDDPRQRSELRRMSESCSAMAADLTAADTLASDEGDNVYYIDVEQPANRVALKSKPVSVAQMLNEEVFGRSPVIATSATLTTDGHFAYAARELGVDQAVTLVAPSPFDWQKQCLVVTPDMPDPTSSNYADQVGFALEKIVQMAQGRTLGLFTSHRAMKAAAEHLRECGLPYTILVQGEAPRSMLVDQFKSDVSSILLGTESFWAGVDVPGEACSVVVIDKLPFAPPDDPVLDVLQERMGWEAFEKHSIPRAVIQLKQGAGRLIRSVTDYGVIVLLDPRVRTKKYGQRFMEALPPGKRSERLKAVGEWFAARQQPQTQVQP